MMVDDGDVFEDRNWTWSYLCLPSSSWSCLDITVCSSQKAINKKKEQTLVTNERGGCGAYNK